MTRTKRQMKSDMKEERRPVGTEPTSANGFEVGMFVVVKQHPWRIARLDKLLVMNGKLYSISATVLGLKPLQSEVFAPLHVRPATFFEFMFNKSGFGKTSWLQFALMLAVFTVIAVGGWVSMDSWRGFFPAFSAGVIATVVYMTYRNFKRKTV